MARNIAEIINDIVNTVSDGASNLYNYVKENVEETFLNSIIDLIRDFDIDKGEIQNTEGNQEKIIDISTNSNSELVDRLKATGYKDEIDNYKLNFDIIDDLNKEYFETELKDPDPLQIVELFNATRKRKSKIITDINNYLLDPFILSSTMLRDINNKIFEAVIFQKTPRELERDIEDLIISSGRSNSKLMVYITQVSRDALSAYHGALQDRARVIYDLDSLTYAGGIKNNSRQNCYSLLNGTGKYEELAIRAGRYRVEDIGLILDRARQCEEHHFTGKEDCGSGFNPSVTIETFAQYRMGYKCLHEVFYGVLLESEK